MKVAEIEGISEYVLENGTRVLLFPDPSKNVVTVNMTVFVGSRHEGYGEAGMAHLLEHMLFKGTPSHPDVPKVLQDRGARFNGTTWVDRTNYYETLPASEENLEFAIRLEADRLVNSLVRGEDLASEMTVVRNEFERGENDPFSILLQRMTAAAYEWHNYGKSTIGNRSDIERVPVDRLRDFYRKFYRADNTLVVVAGKFEPATALDYLQKYFGALPVPEEPIDDTYTTEPPQDGERTVVLRRVGNIQAVGSLYHIPSGSHPDFAAARALTLILGDEPSGRLYQKMVETGLASHIYAFARAYHDPGLLIAAAQVPEDKSIEEARQVLISTLEQDLKDNPITEQELERAKQQILKQRELEAASTDRLAVALTEWAAQGDWRLYFLFRDTVEALTQQQVQEVAERYLVRNNRTAGLFIPTEQAERVSIPEAPDLNALLADYKGRESVAEGEAFDPSPQNIEQRTTRGELTEGIKYAFLPKQTRNESVSLMLTLRYGDAESLEGKVPASELLPTLMSRGTESHTYQELQDELTRLRAELRISGQLGVLQIQVKTQRKHLPEMLDLLHDVIRRPRFEASELEVVRRQTKSVIEQAQKDPQALAALATRRALSPYPSGDVRYVPTLEEELERLDSVSIEDVKALYTEFFSSQAGELAVVGDFEPELVQTKLTEALADWETEIEYTRIDRPAHTDIAGQTNVIETPDKANAVYFASQHYALSDNDPDYPELVLGNFVLGGGSLSSRLGNRVRQQEGLSYGVGTYLSASAKDERAELGVYAISNPENKDRLLSVIAEELKKIQTEGITEDELARAKEGYLQQQTVARTDDARLATLLITTLFNDRTMEFYADQEQQIADATLEEVNKVIGEYIDPQTLVISIAGDFKAAEKAE
ncbi:M16 family metallopeptidase [Candidatus Laterigemmans baculatus]|uniref:M16 family metallopeptidase n=1 Tax=Candidatus Laterigemmans baculatus TaxID=2770505 RepID=UPI001F20A2D3|nr:pitrilysin family protein [Candidatus Laterigemmans baculatus]